MQLHDSFIARSAAPRATRVGVGSASVASYSLVYAAGNSSSRPMSAGTNTMVDGGAMDGNVRKRNTHILHLEIQPNTPMNK